jgi:hypothetical protein
MADNYDPAQDPMSPSWAPFHDAGTVNWSDRGRAVVQGAAETGAGLASGARATAEATDSPNAAAIADFFRSTLKLGAERAGDGMSDEAKQELQSSIASPEFWDHPVSAAVLKSLNMAPGVAAAVAPAFFTDGASAILGTAAAGGAMGAGQSADDVYGQTDDLTDKEFQEKMPYYAGLRSMGVSEEKARADANQKLMGLKPLANAVANAAAMVLGPAGRIAGAIPEEAGAGLLTRMGVGAGEGALGGALMGGTAETTHEQTQVQLDTRTELDPATILAATADSALTQSAMGAVGGAVTRVPAEGVKPKVEPRVEPVTPGAPDAAQEVALAPEGGPASPPATTAQPPAGTSEAPAPGFKPPEVFADATPEGMTDSVVAQQPGAAGEALNREFPRVPPNETAPPGPNLADDAGKTVPEAPATLQAQQDQLVNGQRRAMLFPKGGDAPLALPDGMKATTTKDGVFHFNPEHLKRADIYAASKAGRLNDILDLGQYSKADIVPRLAAGEAPVAVTERTPGGTEVKAAGGTTGTAPEQVASLEASKTPGNKISIETPAQVLQDRIATPRPRVAPPAREVAKIEPVHVPSPALAELDDQAQGRVAAKLESIWQRAEQEAAAGRPPKDGMEAFIEKQRQRLVMEERGAQRTQTEEPAAPRARNAAKDVGKNWSDQERANRAENNQKADDVVARFKPTDVENEYVRPGARGTDARDAIHERVVGMVDAAKREGVTVAGKIKDGKDETMRHNSSSILLTEAAKFTQDIRARKKIPVDRYTEFLNRERELRANDAVGRENVRQARLAAGDEFGKAKRGGDVDKTIDTASARAAEEAKVESIPDENTAPPEAEDKEPMQEPLQTEKPILKGDEYTAGKDSAGTFKVEMKKPRRLQSKQSNAQSFDSPEAAASLQRVEKGIEGKSVHEAAAFVAEHAPRMADRLIARKIQTVLKKMEAAGAEFELHVAHLGDMIPAKVNTLHGSRAATSMNAGNPKVHLWFNGSDVRGKEGTSYQTVLHELVHAVTMRALYAGRNGKGDFQSKQLFRELQQLRNAVVKEFNNNAKRYQAGDMDALSAFQKEAFSGQNNAFRDEDELLAWGLSNSHMQDFLESIPYKGQNMFSSFVDTIRKFLGLPARQGTALSELIRLSENIMDADQFGVNSALGDITDDFYGRPRRSNSLPDQVQAQQAGDFSAGDTDISKMFHEPFTAAIDRGKADAVDFVGKLTEPAKIMASVVDTAKNTGGVLSKVLNAFITDDQYRQKIDHLLPMVRDIFDGQLKAGVLANKLKEDGVELSGALIRAQKANPGLFEKFAKLINDQTMMGADASSEIGEGRNAHLQVSKAVQAKMDLERQTRGPSSHSDYDSDTAMRTWEGRNAHPELKSRYDEIVKQDPQYAPLQKQLFDFYEQRQNEMGRDQIDSILRTYDFKGTDEERATVTDKLHNGKMTDEEKEDLASKLGETLEGGRKAVKAIDATDALKVVKGPYAPQMRRGEHAIVGEYKVNEPDNGSKIDDNTWEFKTRKEAHDFAVKTGLHTDTKSVYYDTATGKPVGSKSDAISTVGQPEQRFQVGVQRNHLEFHESASDARARLEELKKSGIMDKVGMEERRHIESENSEFTGRGIAGLLRSLAAQKHYQDASELERGVMRHTIREAGLRSLSDNRVQSRRLPRRYVQGASDDIARNLMDYNESQANFRAKLKLRPQIEDGLKAMWEHVKENRYGPDNEARSAAANEVERRARAEDPNEYSGAYTRFTRRLATWSYIDRMMRASHLILHQTHLPMITSPYMAGRHGLMSSYGATLKAWKELTGFYSAGGNDAWAHTWGSALQKGTDYTQLGKNAYAKAPDGARVAKMLDVLNETGVIHPAAGIEVHKYLPSKQMSGLMGGIDRGMNKMDTIFRDLTNATEAVNRIAGSTAAYRLEFSKLTRAGKSVDDAHAGAVEYARQTLTDTQGLYSSSNQAPIFKNKFLKPFLQFKQFPQMIYHLLGKLAVTALKGETREAKVQAMASLASILGMHVMMAGVLQGLPLEPFKLLALISKGIGLTDGDWTDVEAAERRSIKSNFGDDVGNLMIHGLGNQALGVDVHHRLGFNSFITYGMPDQLDSKSVSEFLMNAVIGAPGALVADALKGTHKMMSGDIEGGALQAAPLQALRDVHNAVAPSANQYGYQASAADRAKSILGFMPSDKARLAEQKSAVFQATGDYDRARYSFIKSWVNAAPSDRDKIWQQVQVWNEDKTGAEKLTKGDLFKSLGSKSKSEDRGNFVDNIRTNIHNKGIADATSGIY